MNINDAGAVLRRNRWFAELAPELQAALLDAGELRVVEAGKWLFGTGDTPRGVYAVVEGAALSYVMLPRGDDVLVHVAGAGEIFGHAARLGQGPRLATVLAGRRSTFVYLSDAGLNAVGRSFPELWPMLTRLLYRQLASTLDLVAQLLALPARARLAARLVGLTGRQSSAVYLSQAQLAELTGVSRKTVNQVLGSLVADGVLEVGRSRIEVLDAPRLRALALAVE